MKEGQVLWTRDQLILAINLYCKLPFGKMHKGNAEVKDLAAIIGRSPSAVARKLGNFASLDPTLRARNIGGLPNAGELTEKVWKEFYYNWDAEFEKSEELLAKVKHQHVEDLYDIDMSDIQEKGLEKKRLVKTRVNQYRFRQMVLANYSGTCCVTGLTQPALLIASHITLWSKYENNRLNPANGLCLNALHDKAFECGLITVSAKDYTVRVSPFLKKNASTLIKNYFLQYEGKKIILPRKFLPARDFLAIHNEHFKT